jgi:CRISPR-associated protein Cst2
MTTPIYSLSIAARATLDMHSLNNEGGEGNQIQTRMVDIVDQAGQIHNVNAISGDMLRHILAEHFFKLAVDRGLPLCDGCQMFNANRINADAGFVQSLEAEKLSDGQALDRIIERCALDDIAGILVTVGGRSLPRKSVFEFGWVLGLPETAPANNQSFFHVKYASERSEAKRKEEKTERHKKGSEQEQSKSGANLQQAIFHRPASSGEYALVCNIEMSRIGYNDILQQYTIDEAERTRRAQALLESLLYTFVQLNGAMRSAQLPHLVALEGVVSYSNDIMPAPLISPIQTDYQAHIQQVAEALGFTDGQVQPFQDIGTFATTMRGLINEAQPYEINHEKGAV